MAADKQDKVLNVPTLRFPEFSGEWEKYKLGNIMEFTKVRISSSLLTEGNYVSTENMLQDFQGVTCAHNVPEDTNFMEYKQGDVLVSNIRPYLKKVWKADKDGGCSADVFVMRANRNVCIDDFLHHIVANDRFIGYVMSGAKGVKMPRGDKEQMKGFKTALPSLKEQHKVAHLLAIIDERISTQIRIIEDLRNLKVYIHNRVFSKGNTLFGQRNTIRLSDIATKITRKNKGNAINNVLSNSAAMGIVPQVEVFDKEIANENNTANYYVIGNGDFVYNPRKSAQAPFGPINMYKRQMEGIISPLYLCFQVTNINKNYLLHYFMSNVWYSYIYSNGDTGVRHDRVSIKDETFLDMPLYIHTIDKQQEIATMMDQVDAKIVLEELYLTKIQKQKDYLLAAMFV